MDNPPGGRRKQKVYMTGDMKWMNMILGQRSTAAHFPCSKCKWNKAHSHTGLACTHEPRTRLNRIHLATQYKLRTDAGNEPASDDSYFGSQFRMPLINIEPEQIVPFPLHLRLNAFRHVFAKVWQPLVGNTKLQQLFVQFGIKTYSRDGPSGASVIHDLSGPDIVKLFKDPACFEAIMLDAQEQATAPAAATATPATAAASTTPPTPAEDQAARDFLLAHRDVIARQYEQIRDIDKLLRTEADKWTNQHHMDFVVNMVGLSQSWIALGHTKIPPHIHGMAHVQPFVATHQLLMEVGESPIESTHPKFNKRDEANANLSNKDPAERTRRALADIIVSLFAGILNKLVDEKGELLA